MRLKNVMLGGVCCVLLLCGSGVFSPPANDVALNEEGVAGPGIQDADVVIGEPPEPLKPAPRGTCPAGGSGDECFIPIVVGDGVFAGDLSDNTGTVDDTSCIFNDLIDEWYCYTATCTGNATATTCSAATTFDTGLAVFDACGGAEITCNDDTCGLQSSVTFAVVAGTSYQIRVSAFNDSVGTGLFELDISCVGGGGGGPANDDCANAIPILDGATPYSTIGATTDGPADPNCQFDGQTYHDIWYEYTATCTGDLTVSTCDGTAGYDTDLVVYDACDCNNLVTLACNDDFPGCLDFSSQVTVPVVSGNCYLVRIGGWNDGDEGTGTLSLTCDAGGGGGCVCTTTISAYPYTEDFEGEVQCSTSCTGDCPLLGLWQNGTPDDPDWASDANGTGSSGTGPPGDHTPGLGGSGFYLYRETSGTSCQNVTETLDGPCFDLSPLADPEFRFWYHMLGATMGDLSLEVSTDGCATWTTEFAALGDQGPDWNQGVVDLAAYGGMTVNIRFVGVTGGGFTSDMAIDDIGLAEALTGACCNAGLCSIATGGNCTAGGGTYLGDLTACSGLDCNGNGLDDVCEIVEGLAADCNENGIPDDCDIAAGTSLDCQPNGIPDECEEDCNGNGIADECDIASGFSLDCQPDGVPDECQIGAGASGSLATISPFANNNSGSPGGAVYFDVTVGPDDLTITAFETNTTAVAGLPFGVEVFLTPGTRVGVENTPAAWTSVATGTATAAGLNMSTAVAMDNTFDLPAGSSWGMVIVLAGPSGSAGHAYTNGTGTNQHFTNGELTLDLGGGSNTPFVGLFDPRVWNGVIHYGSAGADCNGNLIPDECDIASGFSLDCNGNGIPDECEEDCNGNGIPDDCDIAAGTSPDCNGNGIPDECEVPPIGTGPDCNSNGIPDECEEDCNNNGIPDDCDIAAGTSPDCQPDGIPDECQLGTFQGGSLTMHGSARFIPPSGLRENTVYLFDTVGTLTGQYDQIPGAYEDAWGYRDGASDGTSVYFGWGGGVARHDADGANGTLMFGGANAPGGTYRALAYDPTGNGGNGSLWSASFASVLREVDLAGNILTEFPVDGWSLYGLSYDHNTGNLWGHSGACELLEIDTTTGLVLQSFPSPTPCATQGGLSDVGNGTRVGVIQGTPDAAYSFQLGGGLTGPLSPNPRDWEGQTGNNGHLGVAVVGVGGTLSNDCNGNGIPDECDEDCDRNGVPDDCQETVVCQRTMMIGGQGTCPQPFNVNRNGSLKISLVGDPDFDVTQIDLATVELRRCDGVGGVATHNAGPPGPTFEFEDLNHPNRDDVGCGPNQVSCSCNDNQSGDGIMDLMLAYRSDDLVAALELANEPMGALITLEATGQLLDGTPFRAANCIRLVPPGTGGVSLDVGSNASGIWVEMSPPDIALDEGGYAEFTRNHFVGSVITLTAPSSVEARRFTGWVVNGTLVTRDPTLQITLTEGTTATAAYSKARRKPGAGEPPRRR